MTTAISSPNRQLPDGYVWVAVGGAFLLVAVSFGASIGWKVIGEVISIEEKWKKRNERAA
jgi:hypothetical protein